MPGDGVIETVIGRGYRFVAELGDGVDARAAPEVAQSTRSWSGATRTRGVARGARARAWRAPAALLRQRGAGDRQVDARADIPRRSYPRTVIVSRGSCLEQHGTREPYLAIIEAFAALARSPRGAQAVAALVRYAPTFVAQVP